MESKIISIDSVMSDLFKLGNFFLKDDSISDLVKFSFFYITHSALKKFFLFQNLQQKLYTAVFGLS